MGTVLSTNCECPWSRAVKLPGTTRSLGELNDNPSLLPQATYNNGRYVSIGLIGTGGFSKVFLVRDTATNRQMALKKISKMLLKGSDQSLSLSNILSEKKILIEVNSPFVINFTHSFQDERNLYFVMEYCRGGSLSKYLKEQRHFEEPLARFYLCEIVMGLKALHEEHQVIYRDLKPDNILLTEDGHIRLADFGLSVIGKKFSQTGAGTPEYIAPEILNMLPHTKMVDYWSLGCVAYVMLAGKFPFFHEKRKVQFSMIVRGKFTYPDKPVISKEARSLISGLLVVNPSMRLGFKGTAELMSHPFFRGVDWEKVKRREQRPPLQTSEQTVRVDHSGQGSLPTDYRVAGFTYEETPAITPTYQIQ